jgi:hypothetical protein
MPSLARPVGSKQLFPGKLSFCRAYAVNDGDLATTAAGAFDAGASAALAGTEHVILPGGGSASFHP